MALVILITLLFIAVCVFLFTGAEDGGARQQIVACVLLVAGVVLVVFAEGLGKLAAQGFDPGHSWFPNEAEAQANNMRGLGILSFIAGATERITLVESQRIVGALRRKGRRV